MFRMLPTRKEGGADKKPRRDCRLQCQGTTVVPYFAYGPKQRQGETDVKAGKEPSPKRYPGIPHVIRSADQKSSGDEPPANVSGPKDPSSQRADGLTGHKQGASPPQTCAGKNNCDIAQVQQIVPAPKSDVGRKPSQRPWRSDTSHH